MSDSIEKTLLDSGLINSSDFRRLTDPRTNNWEPRYSAAMSEITRRLLARPDPIVFSELSQAEQAPMLPALLHYVLYLGWISGGTPETLERAKHHHVQYNRELNMISVNSSPVGGWGRGIPIYRS